MEKATEVIVRVTEAGSHLWTGTLEDLLEHGGDLPDEVVSKLTWLRPGARLEVNGFVVERLEEAWVPRIGEAPEDEELTPLDRAEQLLMHAMQVMATASTGVKDLLQDLGPSEVVELRERVEDTANALLGVGSALEDIERELKLE